MGSEKQGLCGRDGVSRPLAASLWKDEFIIPSRRELGGDIVIAAYLCVYVSHTHDVITLASLFLSRCSPNSKLHTKCWGWYYLERIRVATPPSEDQARYRFFQQNLVAKGFV